ncbi:hypothetical protein QMK19_19150 [Streptomyces sp. H10-C2]|uniref:hypothetical protein n=1 Tax=unclassified Streptomyces TaxID=2593676 RepID=UPI0024BA75C7|nr:MULTISPECIES: hypothetical protein [unclassified Streptomyces]MDJ0346224.1 hypothetical protein [Streptomyces sp. PH10-H1]MDJ0371738.1 hypothetical protein [Streptomyces sp. H10-C2]
MKIDLTWAWNVLAHHLPSDPTVWDPSGIEAAIARHASDLVMAPDSSGHDTAWRAAALLHTLTVCPPLESPMNEFYAMAMTRSYCSAAGWKTLPDTVALGDLVERVKTGRTGIQQIAEVLRPLN